ncbi:MAG: acyloxyacyl hydrolase [Pseudomonadota bacterium]
MIRHLIPALAFAALSLTVTGQALAEEELIGTPLNDGQVAAGHGEHDHGGHDHGGWSNFKDGTDHIAVGLAAGNIPLSADGDGEETLLFNLEYRFGHRYLNYTDNDGFDFGIAPFVGGYVGVDGSAYGYAGFGFEFLINDHFVIMPNTAVGLYTDGGDGRDLGHVLEFRSGIELGYRWDNEVQLGLALHHLSNASIGDSNPGTEHLTVFLNIPLNGELF